MKFRHQKTFLFGALALLGLPALAFAQAPETDPEPTASRASAHWARFSEDIDTNQDGVVSREEFQNNESRFERLDSNGDGQLTEADFEGRGKRIHAKRRHAGGQGIGPMLIGADADKSGDISSQEWQSFLLSLDGNGDGVLAQEELVSYKKAQMEARAEQRGRQLERRAEPAGKRFDSLVESLDLDSDGLLETEDLEAAYAKLDADSNGTLDASEMPRFRRRGPRGHHPGRLLGQADVNQDQELTREEWQGFLTDLDQDGDGQLSGAEIAAAAGPEAPTPRHERPARDIEEISAVFDKLDEDGDGVIAGEEWPKRRERHRARRHAAGPRGTDS